MTEALTVTRDIVVKADVARVWAAITQAENLSRWISMRVAFAQLAVGEAITFTDEDGGLTERGDIVVVEPPTRFAFRWPAAEGHPALTTVTFTLDAVDDGTRVTVTETGFEALPEVLRQPRRDQNDGGWRTILDTLAAEMATPA